MPGFCRAAQVAAAVPLFGDDMSGLTIPDQIKYITAIFDGPPKTREVNIERFIKTTRLDADMLNMIADEMLKMTAITIEGTVKILKIQCDKCMALMKELQK